MISISMAVTIFMWLLIGGIIFGILFMLANYCEKEFPGYPLFFKMARVLLYILAVLVVIGVLLGVVGGRQIFVP